MSDPQHILIPSKFISIILHLLVVTMGFFSYHDNILSAYHNLTTKTQTQYIGAQASFLACSILSVIFLFIQIIILFVGTTMFRERHTFIVTTLHFLAIILWSSFIYQQWQFSSIWAIWAVCSFLPVTLEIITAVSVSRK